MYRELDDNDVCYTSEMENNEKFTSKLCSLAILQKKKLLKI